ncbi:M24 family metallopeptidase [Thermus filiformis]|uniref:Peptidase M24 n=1 Tax=Thermus filiformis TaxID=276 RepID=A0A0D6XA12_THEFI|nr:aminopeptidase P family N-terminal domain-containing protein [Thermus filiformis]KIX84769.1 peptidase M24 [Thermus filiformis]
MNPAHLERLRAWMEERGFPRFFVARPENFAWLTGGANTLGMGEAVAYLEVGEEVVLHTSRIEHPRMAEEEAPGLAVRVHPWTAFLPPPAPNDLEHDLTPLRLVLSPKAQEDFLRLGREAAEEVLLGLGGEDQAQLAGALAEALWGRGIRPLLLLVAGEERLFRHRHPLPKDRPLGRAFMAVVCAERGGLVANLTRMAAFGHKEVEGRYREVLEVERVALERSRPGATLGEVFAALEEAYARLGHPGAWEEHHQGGVGGYRSREVLALPGHPLALRVGMALAWNPSLPGAKVEDTFLLREGGLENLTEDSRWPQVVVGGRARPDLWRG